MNCKLLLTADEMNRSIDSLRSLLNSKVGARHQDSLRPARLRSDETDQDERYVFLKGELLMFGEMTRSEVVAALQDIGLDGSAVTIITEGDPLYFVDGPTSDTYKPFDYFLRQTDLPYGFAGPDGTFQFSSPEVAALRRSAAPQVVDNAYVYMGEDGGYISYAEIAGSSSRVNLYTPMMYGLGWTQSNTKQGAEKEAQAGQFTNITLRNSFNLPERRDFVDKDRFINDIRYSWGGSWGAN